MLKEQIKEIKKQLRLSMNGVVSSNMRNRGLSYKLNFGVELPRIKMIAQKFDKNHDLAQALWKEDIRECKILAGLLQPVDSFCPEIADIWVEAMPNIEIAELTVMNLFQHLPYAPAKSLQWISDDREYFQTCGFLTAVRLIMQKGDMIDRVSSELLDQAICAIHSDDYNVRKSATLLIAKYMSHSVDNAFKVCRLTEHMANSSDQYEIDFYEVVKEEAQNVTP